MSSASSEHSADLARANWDYSSS